MSRRKIETTSIDAKLEVVATCTVARLRDGRLAILAEAKQGEEWGSLLSLVEDHLPEDLARSVAEATEPRPRRRKKVPACEP